MKIALIGYGKMGRTIEKIAVERGHEISSIINIENTSDIERLTPDNTDVAIEFTSPDSALQNVLSCLNNHVKVVSGSTGWLDEIQQVKQLLVKKNGTFFYASNYSVGVNITFRLNEILAKMMEGKGYDVSMEEIHHVHKIDSPSGTAITLADGIINNNREVAKWKEGGETKKDTLAINSIREGEVPGTHVINYNSSEDSIQLKHTAHSRSGFALGAVLVSEWILNKTGFLTMDDYFDFSV